LKKIKKITIFCDGGLKIGFGHIRRSLSLYQLFKKNNYKTNILPLSRYCKKFLPKKDIKSMSNLILFDGPYNQSNQKKLNKLKNSGKTIITMDWFGNFVPDYNIVIYPHKKVNAKLLKFIGLDYIIINQKFIDFKKNINTKKTKFKKLSNKKVLIMVGGGDILGLGKKNAEYLNKLGFKVTLVKGPLVKKKLYSSKIKIVNNPNNLPKILNQNDWIVTNAGNSLFEAIYLKKPTYVLPQSKEELRIAKLFKKKKLILGFGKKVKEIPSPKRVKNFYQSKENVIDAKGAYRILKVVNNLL